MATNVRYLEAEGTTRPAAVAIVAANSAARFLVHVIGILAIVPLLRANRVHLNFWGSDLPDRWRYLFVVIIALTGAGLLRWGRRLYRRVDTPLRDASVAALVTRSVIRRLPPIRQHRRDIRLRPRAHCRLPRLWHQPECAGRPRDLPRRVGHRVSRTDTRWTWRNRSDPGWRTRRRRRAGRSGSQPRCSRTASSPTGVP